MATEKYYCLCLVVLMFSWSCDAWLFCRPVNCVWGSWSSWTSCSVSCGSGWRDRYRIVIRYQSCGGYSCRGSNRQADSCYRWKNCQWSPWSQGQCSESCGGGSQVLQRYRLPGGSCGKCGGASMDWRECNTDLCPVDCHWGAWGAYGSCSAPCGGGTQNRTRSYVLPSEGSEFSGSGSGSGSNGYKISPTQSTWWDMSDDAKSWCSNHSVSTRYCNSHMCPIDCEWSPWKDLEVCSRSCGGGQQSRHRFVIVEAQYGGKACWENSFLTRACNTHPCPVHCQWGPWSDFGSCNVSCGAGLQWRNRSVAIPAQHAGESCVGPSSSSRPCNTHCCPVDCVWEPWYFESECSQECGGGMHFKFRQPTQEQCGGDECSGDFIANFECNTHPCPVDCKLGNWSDFGQCNATCGFGNQYRIREIVVKDQHGGKPCVGATIENRTCNEHPCPVHCMWESWSDFGECSLSCGGGNQTRNRSVSVWPMYGGLPCNGSATSAQPCNTHPCPVHCRWSEWSNFTGCSMSCGGGLKTRSRALVQLPLHGGRNCTGFSEDVQHCNTQCCSVNCEWGEWMPWTGCSETCSGGAQYRKRTIAHTSACNGSECSGPSTETKECNTECCPVHCATSPWSKWSKCGKACGVASRRFRNRTVITKDTCGGKACPDLDDAEDCPVLCHNGANATATHCVCRPGWSGLCCESDVDECKDEMSNCHGNATCTNNDGSFQCQCNEGFSGNGTLCAAWSEETPANKTGLAPVYAVVAAVLLASLIVISICILRKRRIRKNHNDEAIRDEDL